MSWNALPYQIYDLLNAEKMCTISYNNIKPTSLHFMWTKSLTMLCIRAVWCQGERLSHAVGCAFAACLERKQKREKECGVTATFDANRTTFTREGSFRVTTATEQAEREEVMRQLQDAKKGVCVRGLIQCTRIVQKSKENSEWRRIRFIGVYMGFIKIKIYCIFF